MLFVTETEDAAQRIHMAKAAGMDAVEFWFWSNKNLDAIEDALGETGLPLIGVLAEPLAELTRTADHQRFLEGLDQSLAVARRLGATMLIAQSGPSFPDMPQAEQQAALIQVLTRAADMLKGAGVRLALEPLNTRLSTKNHYVSSTIEGLDIVDAVGRAEVQLLYDLFHSRAMEENMEAVLEGRVDRLAHVHVADYPGRHQLGTGTMPIQSQLDWLSVQGYKGLVGLEFSPLGSSADAIAATLTALRPRSF